LKNNKKLKLYFKLYRAIFILEMVQVERDERKGINDQMVISGSLWWLIKKTWGA